MPEHHKRRATTPGAAGASPAYRNRGAIDTDGTRKALDTADNVRWFWYSTLGKFPEPPRIPHDPAEADNTQINFSPGWASSAGGGVPRKANRTDERGLMHLRVCGPFL